MKVAQSGPSCSDAIVGNDGYHILTAGYVNPAIKK